jgi:murein L,D-transpeptidase YcbB/YkuD
MSPRGLIPLVAGVLAVSLVTSASAQQSYFCLFCKPRPAPVTQIGHAKPKVATQDAVDDVDRPAALPPVVRPGTPVIVPIAIQEPAYPISDALIDPVAAAVRGALRDAGREGGFTDKRDAAGVAEYYAGQGYVLAWFADGRLSDRARAIIGRLAAADADGLDASEYKMPPLGLGRYAPAAPAVLAKADVMLSNAIVTYAREAYAGRLVPASLSPNIGYEQHLLDPVGVLRNLAVTDDPVATLSSYNPPQKEFALLRDKLAELRAGVKPEKLPVIPGGATLKPGMSDPRVVLLRQRFGLPADVATPEVYDETVVAAVKAFQEKASAKADGIIGKGALAIINKPPVDLIPLILANMERWRWMPRYLGDFYVRVNIPNFDLDVYQNDKLIHNTRVVVGKVELPTPIFSDEIEHAIVNPSWNVPPSIIAREYLPALRNGGYPKGFQIFARVGGRFRPVDPGMVDWASVSAKDLQFKQPPGERNALGVIKFMFPNKYSVYLHDTPSKALFQQPYRAYSHGCIRVMDPWAFASVLLTQEPGWDVARLKKLVGGPEKQVIFPQHIPVHITYFTAWIDAAGELQVRNDVYGHDQRVEEALGLVSDQS